MKLTHSPAEPAHQNRGLWPPQTADFGVSSSWISVYFCTWTRPHVPDYSRHTQTSLLVGQCTVPTSSQESFKNRKLKSSSTVYLNLLYMESIYQDDLISFRFGFLASRAALELPKSRFQSCLARTPSLTPKLCSWF